MNNKRPMIRRQTLLKRGWTERMIEKLLGNADAGGAGRYFLYHGDRVEQVEATEKFANFDTESAPGDLHQQGRIKIPGLVG